MRRREFAHIAALLLSVSLVLGVRAQVAPKPPTVVTSGQRATATLRAPQPEPWVLVDLSKVGNRLDFLRTTERAEQVLDLAFLGSILRDRPDGATAKKVVARWPVLRQEELESTQTFLAGPVRYLSLDSSSLYGLIPEEGTRDLRIAEMLDQHRMVYGSLPTSLSVFEYRKTDPAAALPSASKEPDSALLGRLAKSDTPDMRIWVRKITVHPASWYYTEEGGYVTVRVVAVGDLMHLLQSVDDIVSVQKQAGVLVVGGRRWSKESANRLTVDDVGAIYQADRNLADVVQQNMRKGLTPNYMSLLDRRLRTLVSADPAALDSTESFEDRLKRYQDSLAGSDLFQLYADDEIKAAFKEKTPQIGFSLDPRTNYADVANAISSILTKNPDASLTTALTSSELRKLADVARTRSASLDRFATEARKENVSPLYEFHDAFDVDFSRPPTPSSSRPVVLEMQRMLESQGSTSTGLDGLMGTRTRAAVQYFQKKSALPDTGVLDDRTWKTLLRDSSDIVGDLDTLGSGLMDLLRENRYQCARYDGALQGTEVGMTLFYTDLMMKLWSMDYKDSTPAIAGFIPETDYVVSELHWDQERQFSVARSWLAARPEGFEVDAAGVRFGPVATRLLAASSDPLRPGKEILPTYSVERSHRWWNRNYKAVADYEPQYHRLNQIQKWSLIFDWMKTSRVTPIAGLDQVAVRHDLVFNKWMKAHPELRYQGNLPWLNSAEIGESTECLKIVVSRPTDAFGYDKYWTISGGVSAGDREAVTARLGDSAKRSTWLGERQAGMEYGKSSSKIAETEISYWDGRKLRVPKSTQSMEATFIPKLGVKPSSNDLALSGSTMRVEATVNKAAEDFSIHTEAGLLKTLSFKTEPGRIEIALNDGVVGELQRKVSGKLPAHGIPISDGSELVWLDDAKVWAKTKDAGLKPSEWVGDLQLPNRSLRAERGVVDAGILSSAESDMLLQSNWNKVSWNDTGKMRAGLSSAPPADGVPAEVIGSWGSRTVSITPRELYISRPGSIARDQIEPAFDSLRLLDSTQLKAIVADRERASLVLIGGKKGAILAFGRKATAEQRAAALKLADELPIGLDMVILRDGQGAAATLPEGVIGLSVEALREDGPKVAKLFDMIDDDPRLGFVLKRQITRAELDAISGLDSLQSASYLEFNGISSLKSGSALADLRISDDTLASVVRVGNENKTIRIAPQQRESILAMRRQLVGVYGNGDDIPLQKTMDITGPYYDYLQSVVKSSESKRIIVRSDGYIDPAMVWALHGGDAEVTFVWDQQDVKQSVQNSDKTIVPDPSRIIMGVSREAAVDFSDLGKKLAAIDATLLASSHELSLEDVEDLSSDDKSDTIVWIADEEDIIDLETDVDTLGLEDPPKTKDVLFLVCDCRPSMIEALSESGHFSRVGWTQYSLLDDEGPAKVLDVVTDFVDLVSTGIAVLDSAELQSRVRDQSLIEEIRSVSAVSGNQWSLNLKQVSEQLRKRLQPVREWVLSKVGPRKGPLDAEHPNRDFDSLIESIGRDRIKAAKTGPAGLDVGRTLRSIPRYKVENIPAPRFQIGPDSRTVLVG